MEALLAASTSDKNTLTFYENIRLHLENQYLLAHYDEFSCHCFTVSLDFSRYIYIIFIFNIQSQITTARRR